MRQECRECSSVRARERVLHKSDQKSATSKRPTTITTASSKTTATAKKKNFYLYIFTTESATTLSLRTLCPTDCQVEQQKWRGSHL